MWNSQSVSWIGNRCPWGICFILSPERHVWERTTRKPRNTTFLFIRQQAFECNQWNDGFLEKRPMHTQPATMRLQQTHKPLLTADRQRYFWQQSRMPHWSTQRCAPLQSHYSPDYTHSGRTLWETKRSSLGSANIVKRENKSEGD